MEKISIIGSGNVGATAAMLIAGNALADVVLLDIVGGVPQGKALDISQAMSLFDSKAMVGGTDDYADLTGSSVVVVAAGLPRQPGMSRLDLLKKNAAIVESVIGQAVKSAPAAILLMVTNPLDIMTYLAYKKSGLPKERVMGMGGLLDSARMRFFLAQMGNVPVTEVDAMVIGAHGDEMVPLVSQAKISGRLAAECLSPEELQAAVEGTKLVGAAIVELLKTGSAFYAPGAAIYQMVKAILNDEKRLTSTCCLAAGKYGLDGIFINLPAIIGAGGVEEIVELEISDEERAALERSAAGVKKAIKELGI